MADMFYPQLKTGAIAHHPVRKTIETRTVTNVLPGGNVFMYPDEAAQKTIWSWEYVGATVDEATTILKFFEACEGRLRPFTFLDPVGNLLSGSSDFRSDGWQLSSMLT